jgi:hypothetical protein
MRREQIVAPAWRLGRLMYRVLFLCFLLVFF